MKSPLLKAAILAAVIAGLAGCGGNDTATDTNAAGAAGPSKNPPPLPALAPKKQ